MWTCRHELGHCWTAPLAAEFSQAVTAHGTASVLALAAREGWSDRAEDLIAQRERQAEALAVCWGLAP